MAIYSFIPLTTSSAILIWRIEESLATLQAQLHPLFLPSFSNHRFASQERIRQYLAARLALCGLLDKLALPILPIYTTARGKPFVENNSIYLSFAHTTYFAVAAVSTDCPIGIDIEITKPKLRMVQEKILCPKELQHADHCLKKLAIYWAAKEALYKMMDPQHLFNYKNIFIEPFQLQPKGKIKVHFHQEKYIMDYQQMLDTIECMPHCWVVCQK